MRYRVVGRRSESTFPRDLRNCFENLVDVAFDVLTASVDLLPPDFGVLKFRALNLDPRQGDRILRDGLGYFFLADRLPLHHPLGPCYRFGRRAPLGLGQRELGHLPSDFDLQSRKFIGEIVIHTFEAGDQKADLVKGRLVRLFPDYGCGIEGLAPLKMLPRDLNLGLDLLER